MRKVKTKLPVGAGETEAGPPAKPAPKKMKQSKKAAVKTVPSGRPERKPPSRNRVDRKIEEVGR